jgi:membrane carboxypeptidase/penicillin-binding protein PbpC
LEKGYTPATLYWDVPKTYTNQYGQAFTPRNYDGKFHGPMLMREALARSMNIPAVDTLDFVTLPTFLDLTNRVGINFPPTPQYGLALTLGGGDSTLLNLTEAYSVLASNGVHLKPTAITRVTLQDGTVVRDYTQTQGAQEVRPEHAYLITHMLSDNNARIKSFGRNNVLNLPFPAAAKTGTTNDFRDNLTVGYSTQFVVGVWVGNADNSEMRGVSGITGAAPIWREVMLALHKDQPPAPFARPAGVVEAEVCALGGRLPSPNCPQRVREVFTTEQGPLPPDENVERAVAARDPALAQTAPTPAAAPVSPDIVIVQPANGAVFNRGLLSIQGSVNPPGFQQYQVEYGEGDNPGEWKWISGPHLSAVENGQLTQWGLESLAPGRYTLRVTVQTSNGPLVGLSRFDVAP